MSNKKSVFCSECRWSRTGSGSNNCKPKIGVETIPQDYNYREKKCDVFGDFKQSDQNKNNDCPFWMGLFPPTTRGMS